MEREHLRHNPPIIWAIGPLELALDNLEQKGNNKWPNIEAHCVANVRADSTNQVQRMRSANNEACRDRLPVAEGASPKIHMSEGAVALRCCGEKSRLEFFRKTKPNH